MKKTSLLMFPAFALALYASALGASASTGSDFGYRHAKPVLPEKPKLTIDYFNDASIDNQVSADSNTGYNEVKGNGQDPFIQTGDASSDNWVESKANDIQSEIDAKAQQTSDLQVSHGNQASVKNKVSATSNTGYNRANFNTGEVAIVTGKASSSNTVLNMVNSVVSKIQK